MMRELHGKGPAYAKKDQIGFETVLHPGDVIVWYAGWSHGTEAIDAPSLALSIEFALPPPRAYIAKYREVLELHSRAIKSYGSCFAKWESDWAVFTAKNLITTKTKHDDL